MNHPLIFLDIDGVLNSHDWWRRRGGIRPEAELVAELGLPRCVIDETPNHHGEAA